MRRCWSEGIKLQGSRMNKDSLFLARVWRAWRTWDIPSRICRIWGNRKARSSNCDSWAIKQTVWPPQEAWLPRRRLKDPSKEANHYGGSSNPECDRTFPSFLNTKAEATDVFLALFSSGPWKARKGWRAVVDQLPEAWGGLKSKVQSNMAEHSTVFLKGKGTVHTSVTPGILIKKTPIPGLLSNPTEPACQGFRDRNQDGSQAPRDMITLHVYGWNAGAGKNCSQINLRQVTS